MRLDVAEMTVGLSKGWDLIIYRVTGQISSPPKKYKTENRNGKLQV